MSNLPDDWKEYPLNELYDFRSGLSKPRSEFGFGYGFLSFKDVFYNFFVPDKLSELVNSTEQERQSCSIKKGDVFLTRTSETMDELGMSCIALKDYEGATFNGFTKRLRPKINISIIPEYAGYFFRSPKFRYEVTAMSSLCTRASLNNEMLGRLKIILPSIEEQSAIGYILKSLDDKIELNQQMNQTLEAIARAIFKSWFVDFDPVRAKMAGNQPVGMDAATANLFPDSFEESELGLIPKGWRVGRLDDLLILQRGFDLPKSKRIYGCYPIIAASGFSDNHIEYKVKGPGVTTGRSGVLGNVFYIHDNFWPLNTSLWVKEFRIAKPIYAYHYLRTLELEAFNAGSAVPTLNRNHIHSLSSIIPSKSIIQEFENLINAMFRKRYQNHKESRTLANIRDTLLPKLMSGEIRVKEAKTIIKEVN